MKRPTQAAYNKLERATAKRITTLAGRLASGKLTPADWSGEMIDLLADKHGGAAALGRQRAGDLTARNDDDDLLGAAVADEEARYLQGFVAAIGAGKYTGADGKLDKDKLTRRAVLYSRKLLATANEAFVQASDPVDLFDWHLGPTEDNCDECPALAEGGPYTPETIPTYPRAGATPCMFHCKCSLVRADGINGFLAPE